MDIEALLKPVSDDQPCGDDLGYDKKFQDLELAVEARPPQQMGSKESAGKESDWHQARKIALDLSKETHDIRIAVMLSQSLLAIEGLSSFADGIQYIHGLLDKYWDCVYPQQDEGDEYPISRMNTLIGLANRDVTLQLLRHLPLISVKGIGNFNLLDIEIAEGKRQPDKDQTDPPSEAIISAAFKGLGQENNSESLQTVENNIQQLDRLKGLLKTIVETLNNKVSAVNSPDLSPLIDTISELNAIYHKYYQPMESSIPGTEQASAESSSSVSVGGAIRSREEALQTIDLICDYFTHYEPSSPVPLVLKRAKRMVNMDFIQILQDVVPDSVSQAETIIHGNKTDS